MSSSDILEISVKSAVGGAQYVYMHIPADALRHTVDGLFHPLLRTRRLMPFRDSVIDGYTAMI